MYAVYYANTMMIIIIIIIITLLLPYSPKHSISSIYFSSPSSFIVSATFCQQSLAILCSNSSSHLFLQACTDAPRHTTLSTYVRLQTHTHNM